MPSAWRRRADVGLGRARRVARAADREKPSASAAAAASAASATSAARRGERRRSSSTISSPMCSRNHGSILVSVVRSRRPSCRPAARLTWKSRSGVGAASMVCSDSSVVVGQPVVAGASGPHPARRGRSRAPRSAFWSASLNVRPMAITSPTDFICVVERRVGARGTSRRPSAGSSPRRSRCAGSKRRGRLSRDVVRASRRACSRRRAWRAIFAIGKPVAFDASAERARHPRVHLDDDHARRRRGSPRTGCSSRPSRRRSRG